MKLDTHGIRFRFWTVFFAMAVGITMMIGILQVGLIRPYYRNSKINAVKVVADAIEDDLIEDGSSEGIASALRQAVDNNVCIVIYNDAGKRVYNADSLGAGCVFNASTRHNASRTPDHLKSALAENDGEYSENVVNEVTEQETIVYGRTIRGNLSNYYLFVNSPLEPVDSIVTFFQRQYFLYMIIVIAAASGVGLYVARTVTDPIVRMEKEAQKLAMADYNAAFEGGTYTETKELAETLNTAKDKLSHIDELRRDLIANVSHDIRTPLTNIRAYSEMIRDISGNNPEKRTAHLNVILRETQYMNKLVNDMSELAKMQSGNYVLNLTNMDLTETIYDIAEMDQPLIDKGDIHLELEVEEGLTVFADEIKISQVVANYLSNAIKHTPPGRRILVRAFTKKDEETVRIEVHNEGAGIKKEELPVIWDRYQKTSKSFSRSMTNTGLGLAIVKAIGDSHHAEYGVESEEGQGAMFWFELRETHEA